MEYSPPPLFKQGASARAKVVFFSLIAITLLVADSRVRSLSMIRQAVGTVLYPLQMVALIPRNIVLNVGDYFTSLDSMGQENKKLKLQQVANAQMLQQAQQLAAENSQLRKLLGASEQIVVPSLMTEILYDARDKSTRKIVVDRGSRDGAALGQPVIDDAGVVGQITRVFPFTSEVTLLTDKDQAIPVQVVRSGLRSVAYGRGQSGVLDLRFMAANADIRPGDVLVTSGIDGVYPPGLAVARVSQVENKSNDTFAQILCQPAAGIDRNRQLLILLADTEIMPRPESEEERDKKDKLGNKRSRDMVRDSARDAGLDAPAGVPGVAVVTGVGAAVTPAPVPATPAVAAPTLLKDAPKAPPATTVAAPDKTAPATLVKPAAAAPQNAAPATTPIPAAAPVTTAPATTAPATPAAPLAAPPPPAQQPKAPAP